MWMKEHRTPARSQALFYQIARAAQIALSRAPQEVCLHRQWSRFEFCDETTLCRLTDDLC